MKTTEMMVEFLIAGILILCSVLFLTLSIFPDYTEQLFNYFGSKDFSLTQVSLFMSVFLAVSYGLGVLSETVGLWPFESLLNLIRKYNREKIEDTHDTMLKLKVFNKVEEKDSDSYTGLMRLFVLKKSNEDALYSEIMSQLNRMRLIRVLFITEVIFLIGCCFNIMHRFDNAAWFLWALVISIIISSSAIILATHRESYRDFMKFVRSCLTNWRSYTILFLFIIQAILLIACCSIIWYKCIYESQDRASWTTERTYQIINVAKNIIDPIAPINKENSTLHRRDTDTANTNSISDSVWLVIALCITISINCTLFAIKRRFERYCKAVIVSFILLYDKDLI
jgi:hypothetical protein